MLDDHAPFTRIISDEANATDRQWLRMLSESFETVSLEGMIRAGMDDQFAIRVLGLVALSRRFNQAA